MWRYFSKQEKIKRLAIELAGRKEKYLYINKTLAGQTPGAYWMEYQANLLQEIAVLKAKIEFLRQEPQ